MDPAAFHVFLSHNSADKPAVEELAFRLRKEGVEPWLDKWNLIPGAPWQPAIEDALEDCATCAVFVGPSGLGPWQNEEMRAAIDRRVSRKDGFRVIPVLLPGGQREERSRLPTFLVATTWVKFRRTLDEEDAFHRLVCGIRGIAPGPGPGQAVFEGVCPYRGLQVFRTEDAPFFFGREALTEWLLTKLRPAPGNGRENRFLAIIGASGSGKSSLARAGLVPALQRGELEGSEQWPVVICKPGPNPLESLAVALAADATVGKGIGVADLINHLRDDPHTLHLTVRVALHGGPETRRVVVLVDQFEEIFTLCHDDALRQALIDNLCHASSIVLGQTVVIVTMRADFYGKCSAYPTLAAALSDHQLLVGPMTEDELQRAIEQPAQLVGCEVEPGLTEILLQAVKKQVGALPLLEHALLELWKQRDGRRLTVAAYREIGELEGALEQHANQVYESLSATEQDICQRILLRLTQPGEGTEDTKRRALRKELGDSESVDIVIQKLANARLITTEGGKQQAAEAEDQRRNEAYVEVSHEALIRGWPILRGWIDANRERLRIQYRLSDAASEWDAQNQDEAYLYRGVRLAEAEEWSQTQGDNLNRLEQAFLAASKALRDRQLQEQIRTANRLRRRAWMAGGIAVVAALLAVVAFRMFFSAQEAEKEATRQLETTYWISGVNERDRNNNPLKASYYFMNAANLADDPARSNNARLAGTLLVEGVRLAAILEHQHWVRGAVYSADGRWILTWGGDGTARLWDSGSGQPLGEPMRHQGGVVGAVYSADGRRILTWSQDGTARLWDSGSGQPLGEPMRHQGRVDGAVYSVDGRRILTWSYDGTARLWDSGSGQPLTETMRHQGGVVGAVYSADGRRILTWSGDGTARLWDSDTGQPLTEPMRHQKQVNGAVYSADGRRILTWSDDGTARLWNLEVDYTWPKEYLVLQVEVFTGTRLNKVGDLQALSAEEWQKKKDQYEKIKSQLAAK